MNTEELAILVKNGQTEYLSELWERVRPLCSWMARRYYCRLEDSGKTHGCEVDDLIQQGFFALYDACASFLPEKAAFSTHFGWYLRNRFAEAAGIRSSKRDPILSSVSFDAPLSDDDDDGDHYDVIPSNADTAGAAIERVYKAELHQRLEDVLDDLPENEAELMRLLFWEGMTAAEIAEITGEQVLKIHRSREKAMRRLHHAVRFTRHGRALRKYIDLQPDCFNRAAELAAVQHLAYEQ